MTKTRNFLLAIAVSMIAGSAGASADQVRAGWAEVIHFPGLQAQLNAKLDTGAKTSALGTHDLKRFKRGGRDWVSFTLHLGADQTRSVEREVLRLAKVKRAGAPTQTRPVIALMACVAGITRRTEFTLNNRHGMAYPVLLGRRFLAGHILVDASVQNITSEACSP